MNHNIEAPPRRRMKSEKVMKKLPDALPNRFRLFRVVGFAARVSAFVFALGCPLSLALYFSGSVLPETALKIVGLTTINALLFLVPSILLTSRVVGKIMLSEDGKYLKISHLSIFGKRKDIYVTPQDLIFKKTNEKTIMKVIKFQNSSKKLIFFPSSGTQDTEFEILDEIFGWKLARNPTDKQL
ncbi:hypothetical protein Btru_051788 [Bulinus truncatus]|nr:hypothetical protein Btru_051788 [Bulinus truncatus]